MLNKFLLVPVTLWLLLPPGICVCQGFGNLLPFLAAKTITADTGPICEDTEHAPWCPEHKMSYLSDGGAPLVHPPDADVASVLPAFTPGLNVADRVSCAVAPTAHPADFPIYLNLCALRI